jgi:hypothetical protein
MKNLSNNCSIFKHSCINLYVHCTHRSGYLLHTEKKGGERRKDLSMIGDNGSGEGGSDPMNGRQMK